MAIARVNTLNGNNSASGTSIATSAGSHTAANNLVVLVAWGSTSVTISSIANTAGDTFAVCTGTTGATSSGTSYAIYIAHNINGNASDVTTVTFSGSTAWRSVTVVQYSGMHTSAAFEVGATGSGTTTVTSGSFSPAASGNVNVAWGVPENSGNWTAGTNYTIILEDASNRAAEERLSAPSGAQTASMTFTSGSPTNGISVGSFKPAAAAAVTPHHLMTLQAGR